MFLITKTTSCRWQCLLCILCYYIHYDRFNKPTSTEHDEAYAKLLTEGNRALIGKLQLNQRIITKEKKSRVCLDMFFGLIVYLSIF